MTYKMRYFEADYQDLIFQGRESDMDHVWPYETVMTVTVQTRIPVHAYFFTLEITYIKDVLEDLVRKGKFPFGSDIGYHLSFHPLRKKIEDFKLDILPTVVISIEELCEGDTSPTFYDYMVTESFLGFVAKDCLSWMKSTRKFIEDLFW